MALKRKLTVAEYEAITSADIKAEYKKSGDEYLLDADDAAELTRSNAAIRQQVKTANDALKVAQTEREELQAQLDALSHTENVKKGDVEAVTKSYEAKIAKITGDSTAALEKVTGRIKTSALEAAATALASQISTSPKLMLPIIKARMAVDLDDDFAPSVKILDDAGKPSAYTVDDLRKELLANKEFSAILVASKASGAGTTPARGGAPANQHSTSQPNPAVKLSSLRGPALTAEVAARVAAKAGASQD